MEKQQDTLPGLPGDYPLADWDELITWGQEEALLPEVSDMQSELPLQEVR